MIPPIEIMKQAYAQQDPPFTESISELIVQEEVLALQEQQDIDIAVTPEEQQIGLTQGPPRTMGFPLEPGANNQFNTVGVPGDIKMTEYANGNPIDSSQILEPGLVGINTHPQTDFVLEEPMYAKTGGIVERPLKDLSFSEKIEKYRKSKRK